MSDKYVLLHFKVNIYKGLIILLTLTVCEITEGPFIEGRSLLTWSHVASLKVTGFWTATIKKNTCNICLYL